METRIGFPAPAGMDPTCPTPRATPSGIPRTRGDGPLTAPVAGSTTLDSPHPRGWTRRPEAPGGRSGGFPAPAGMDPSHELRRRRRRRIPRTRGDGPSFSVFTGVLLSDSPHPRGWTVPEVLDDGAVEGFPAPAGMDPPTISDSEMAPRIPRTRGDGPVRSKSMAWPLTDSPHPRGWTVGEREPAARGAGFPAPAGMDPLSTAVSSSPARIPRTRGDGPRRPRLRAGRASDSPHPRGWTAHRGGQAGGVQGFPAPAGMDPGGSG